MNTLLYYEICFILSVILAFIYIVLWHDGIDVNMTCLFTLIPIVTLGCVWMFWAPTYEIAVLSNKIVYIAGCFWPLFSTKAILSLCNLKIRKVYTVIAFAASFVFYGFALTTDRPGALYRSIDYLVIDGRVELYPEYGWMHTVIYISMTLYIVIGVIALTYAMKNKVRASIRNMRMMLVGEIVTIIVFFIYGIQKLAGSPAILYVISEVLFLIAGYRSYYYNIDSSVMDTIVVEGSLGYITFDMNKRLLGCNQVAEDFFPELKSARTDMPLDSNEGIKGVIAECLDLVEKEKNAVTRIIPCNGKEIIIKVDEYLMRGRKKNFRVIMQDDTDHQALIKYLSKEKEEAQKKTRQVTETFQRYIDPNIADKILKEDIYGGSSASEGTIAVLFADICGFTTYSENKAPRDVLNMLNMVIENVTSNVMANGGIVDKIIGDCVMAVWEEEDNEDAALLACKTALEIKESMKSLGEYTSEEFGTGLHLGFGINYGSAILGNIGNQKRSDYTAIGDTVNVASRLEAIANADEILISSEVAEKLKGRIITEPYVRNVTLKGRRHTTTVLNLKEIIQ